MHQVIGPLNGTVCPGNLLHSPARGHGGAQGDQGRMGWGQVRTKKQGNPQPLSGRADPLPPQPAFACCLAFRHAQAAAGCAGNGHLLHLHVGRVRFFQVSIFSLPHVSGGQFALPQLRCKAVAAFQPVAPLAAAFNLPSLLLQHADPLPYSGSADAHLPADLFPGNILPVR